MRIADERAAKRNYTRRTRTVPRQKRIEFRYRAEEAASERGKEKVKSLGNPGRKLDAPFSQHTHVPARGIPSFSFRSRRKAIHGSGRLILTGRLLISLLSGDSSLRVRRVSGKGGTREVRKPRA